MDLSSGILIRCFTTEARKQGMVVMWLPMYVGCTIETCYWLLRDGETCLHGSFTR